MKGKLFTFLLILIFLTGLSLLLYPTVSDYWNSLHQSRAIASYAQDVASLDGTRYDALWREARAYNEALRRSGNRYLMTEEDRAAYEALLNVSGNGIIGYIEIPKIGCSLPIYHGTDEAVLQIAVGHVEGTSLPTGGPGTHCALSGHRGLPGAKLFTDLDQLAEGDTFVLRVLNEALTYEVDQVLIVLPDETDALQMEDDEDYCTLVTCTPYGINSHRLLVRGRRVENAEEAAPVQVTGNAMQVEPMRVAAAIAAPILLILLTGWLFRGRKR